MGADIIEHESGKFSRAVYIKGGSANPFVFKGNVTTATSSTVFASTGLIGYGNDAFNGWEVYVFYDGAGTGAAPQSEHKPISGYVSSTGTFTHTAFTSDLEVDDVVLILHPYEATGGDATEAKQDTIITDIGVVDGLLDVPAKDDITDAHARDVTGKKDDTAQTTVGTTRSIIAYVKGLLNQVALIKTATDKHAGESPTVGTATHNWNAAEADIVSIGTDDTKKFVHSLILSIDELTTGAVITIRMYMQTNGVERKVYDQDYTKGTDPDGLWIVNGTVGIHEVLRVTAQSDTAADDGKNIDYDYDTEAR